MKPIQINLSDNFGKKRLGKSYSETVDEILKSHSPSYHPSRERDINQDEAIRFLAEQIDTLWAIVKAYKTGKL
jgi:hypothetical protein